MSRRNQTDLIESCLQHRNDCILKVIHIQLNSCLGILSVPCPLQVMHFPGRLLSRLPKRSPVNIYHHQDQALESKRHIQRLVSPVFANKVQPQKYNGLEQGLVFRAQECSEPVHLEGWI